MARLYWAGAAAEGCVARGAERLPGDAGAQHNEPARLRAPAQAPHSSCPTASCRSPSCFRHALCALRSAELVAHLLSRPLSLVVNPTRVLASRPHSTGQEAADEIFDKQQFYKSGGKGDPSAGKRPEAVTSQKKGVAAKKGGKGAPAAKEADKPKFKLW